MRHDAHSWLAPQRSPTAYRVVQPPDDDAVIGTGLTMELPEGVLSHHERWDGGGYPRGLKGRRIPLAARLVAIVDAFDAITQHRCYRRRRSCEFARDVILQGRGTQFDPELVDLFTFPPVFARMIATQRREVRWKPPAYSRRPAHDDTTVPDITFRWHPGRQGARGRRASDRPTRRPR